MKNVLFFILLLCVFNCKANKENTNAEKAKLESADMETTQSRIIAKGNLYGSGNEGIIAQNLIITDQNEWDKLMSQMNSVNKVTDSFAETSLDFSKYTIIAVFADVKGSGGHRIDLSMTSNSENTTVRVTSIAPKEMAATVMTQPYCIIKIAKSNLPILFE